MDSTEFNQHRPLDPRLFELPKIISLKMKLVSFSAPKLKTFKSSLSEYKEALEITIVTEGPIPIRNVPPAIFIGDIVSKHLEEGKGVHEYKFYIFEFKKLKPRETIKWGWINDAPEKANGTGYTYNIDAK